MACLEALGHGATRGLGSLQPSLAQLVDEVSEEEGWFVPEVRLGDFAAFVFGIVGVLVGAFLASRTQSGLQRAQWVEDRRRQVIDDAAGVAATTASYGALYEAMGGGSEEVDQAKAEAEAALAKLRGRLNVLWGEDAGTESIEDLNRALDENNVEGMKSSAAAVHRVVRELPALPTLPTTT